MRLWRKTKNKLGQKTGFTVVEMLAACVVLVLMCVAMMGGVGSISKVYKGMLFSSNSQILEDTLDTAMNDLLTDAEDIRFETVEGKGNIHFTSNRYAASQFGGHLATVDGHINVKTDDEDLASQLEDSFLIEKKAYTGLEIDNLDITHQGNVITVTYDIKDPVQNFEKKSCTFKCKSLTYSE